MRIIEKLAKKTPEFKSNEVKIVSDIKNSISKYKNLFAFLFFVILAIIAIGANPLARETVGPFDLLVSSHGYSSVAPSNMKVRCRERSDILDARFPGLIKLKNEFYYDLKNFNKKKLDLVGNLYVLIWKPSLLIFVCIPNDPLAYYCSQLFKLIISGFGIFLFLRLFLSYPASLFGGIVYMLCGFNAAWFFLATSRHFYVDSMALLGRCCISHFKPNQIPFPYYFNKCIFN